MALTKRLSNAILSKKKKKKNANASQSLLFTHQSQTTNFGYVAGILSQANHNLTKLGRIKSYTELITIMVLYLGNNSTLTYNKLTIIHKTNKEQSKADLTIIRCLDGSPRKMGNQNFPYLQCSLEY